MKTRYRYFYMDKEYGCVISICGCSKPRRVTTHGYCVNVWNETERKWVTPSIPEIYYFQLENWYTYIGKVKL